MHCICLVVKLFSLASYTLLFVWIERQDHSIHMSFVLQVQHLYTAGIPSLIPRLFLVEERGNEPGDEARAYLCWRHTYCQWPIIELAKNVSPKSKMGASHVVQIYTHVRFPRSKKK